MCRVPVQLRELIKQLLADAAEEIFVLLEKNITQYEEQQRHQGALCTPAEVQISEEPPQLERIQIVKAQGPVKEEQVLLSISQTLVKEEPTPPVNDALLASAQVKQERHQSQALSLLFIKQEETEQTITPVPPAPQNGPNTTPLGQDQHQTQDSERNQEPHPEPSLNQNSELKQNLKPEQEEQTLDKIQDQKPEQILDKNLDQNPNQGENEDQGLNEDFEEEENVEWEFEGLTPPRPSPDQTEDSSEDEDAFPPNHPPKLLQVLKPMVLSLTSNTNNVQTNVFDDNDETTENSSDPSDNEGKKTEPPHQNVEEDRKRPLGSAAETKKLRIVSNNMIKTLNITVTAANKTDTTATLTKKQKRKRHSRKKRVKNPEGSNHTCTVCQRTFDSRRKVVAHMKVHAELLPCPVCSKMFKKKGYLDKHMRTHQSVSQENESANKTGQKRKAIPSGASAVLEKRMRLEEQNYTDPDQTENSSDEN